MSGESLVFDVTSGERGDLRFGTTYGMLQQVARHYGEKAAVVDNGVQLTYTQLLAEVRRAARALLALEVTRGDRVAIWAPNNWQWIVAGLATHTVGATLVPINTRYVGDEARYILEKSEARVLFCCDVFLERNYVVSLNESLRGGDGGDGLGALRHCVTLGVSTKPPVDRLAVGSTVSWRDFLVGAELRDDEALDVRIETVEPGDVCDILFTSGTTGKPKGVVSTFAQTLRVFLDWGSIVGLEATDRYLVVVPFFHCFGYKAGWLAGLMRGATVFPHAVFDVQAILRRIARDAISVLPGPPALYESILLYDKLAQVDLSTLRLAVTGAATIPVDLVERMHEVLGFETVLTAYGLTESTGVVTMCRRSDDAVTVATTSGRPIPGVGVKLLDKAGELVPRGEPGEVWVSGYPVMQGYCDAPETNTEVLVNDENGVCWLKTGDIGVLDGAGNLRITDRLKDMFIVGGFNAYPAEIEHVLGGHPAVGQVAVVGAPDPRLGEVACAFVVARPGLRADADELIAWSRERMANFKVPRHVLFVDALPTNATGKVTKAPLRERAAGLGSAQKMAG
jgi:acyl-CoA synthetase (AMP-forming)/AMP-acid ligase II